jgi:hypothetical protein
MIDGTSEVAPPQLVETGFTLVVRESSAGVSAVQPA